MNLHEFQAKQLLMEAGIPVPKFAVVDSLQSAERALDELKWDSAMVKIQVHAGGRGKAGGVKKGSSRQEILKHVKALLNMKMVNNQTGPEGVIAHKLLLSAPEEIAKQYYLACIIDRKKAQATLLISPEGGMEIEEIASKHPEKLLSIPLNLQGELKGYQLRNAALFMGWKGEVAKQGMDLLAKAARLFRKIDASLLEINPLILTPDGRISALDAKISIDDNALFRQPALAKWEDPTQLPEREARAKQFDLSYIALEGNIGCMVNGAGLAMATMDLIKVSGGTPANFLDVGGSATQEKVAEGFKIILSDPSVKAILVNIFGGIMNCVTLAGGIIAAVGELRLPVPLVVRLEGTNAEKGKKMLADSGLDIITADSLAKAAEAAVAAARRS